MENMKNYKKRLVEGYAAEVVGVLPQMIVERFEVIDEYTLRYDLFKPFSNMDEIIDKLKKSLIHSFTTSSQGNCVFVTQIKVYYKDKKIDDVAIISKLNTSPSTIVVEVEKCSKVRGDWLELHLLYTKV
jgi:hypothetical protein